MRQFIACVAFCALQIASFFACGVGAPSRSIPPGLAETASPLDLHDGQDARLAIGQSNLNANDSTLLSGTGGNPALVHGRLYLPDLDHGRVLVWRAMPRASGIPPDFAVGQPDLSSETSGTLAHELHLPMGLSSDGNNLLVADTGNHRVLIFNHAPEDFGAAADVVVGETASTGCTPQLLNYPRGVFTAKGMLLVADTANNRLLIWHTIPTSAGTPADVAIGQPDLQTCGADPNVVTAASLYKPENAWTDGKRLLVVDAFNNRILLWHDLPRVSGVPADVVIGQANKTSSQAGAGRAGLLGPASIASNGVQLAISDTLNNRVVVLDSFPEVDGAPFTTYLGQPSWDENSRRGGPAGMSFTTGLLIIGPRLLVGDTANYRFLLF